VAIEGREDVGAPWSGGGDCIPEATAVACITVGTATGEALGPDKLFDRVMRKVRSDDQVCPIWTGGCVVNFGSSARSVPPETLAERMAAAIDGLGPGGVVVSVGMASASIPMGLDVLTRRSVSSSRSGRPSIIRSTGPTAVTVLDHDCTPAHPGVTLRRRSTREASLRGLSHLRWRHHRVGLPTHGTPSPKPVVLILDGDTDSSRGPGPLARTIHYRAETFGYEAIVQDLACLDLSSFGEVTPGLVVIVLGQTPSNVLPMSWSTSSWHVAPLATTTAIRRGSHVLAVSSRGVGALAACVHHGARALFQLGDLDSHLDPQQSVGSDAGQRDRPNNAEHRPPGFDALLTLTDSERRVLFYLTGGWSAQSIADELVVSLTTVRSHIRSTLRKLGVRSQLAAVAIANGLDFEATRRTEQAVAAARS
jgi:DNA-binding NarL/FixJ family response regulator